MLLLLLLLPLLDCVATGTRMKRATTDRPTALVSVSFSFVGARALRFEREPAGGAGGDRHGRMGSDDGTTTHWVAFCMCPRGASPRLEI
jgi:hypothetical protein